MYLKEPFLVPTGSIPVLRTLCDATGRALQWSNASHAPCFVWHVLVGRMACTCALASADIWALRANSEDEWGGRWRLGGTLPSLALADPMKICPKRRWHEWPPGAAFRRCCSAVGAARMRGDTGPCIIAGPAFVPELSGGPIACGPDWATRSTASDPCRRLARASPRAQSTTFATASLRRCGRSMLRKRGSLSG